MANTPNYGLYKPDRADNIPVDTSLANNFTLIDSIVKDRDNDLTAHKNSTTAHDSANLTHQDTTVEQAIVDLNTRVDNTDNEIIEANERIDDIIAQSGTSDTEVVDARGGFTVLRNRFENTDRSFKVVATVGDGLTDNTAAIQSAIDSDSFDGLWTVIPAGDYMLTSPLILKENTKIIMHRSATLNRFHSDNLFQNGESGDLVGHNNITIIGGKLDLRGQFLNGPTDDGTGIALGYASNVQVSDVDIYNVYYSHGVELAGITNAIVERCGFYGFKLDVGGTRIIAEAIQVERGTTTGFPYFGSNDNSICRNIKIRDCKFGASDDNTAWNVGIGTHQADNNITVDGLEISGCVSVVPLLTKIAQFKGYKNVIFERNFLTAPTGLQIYGDTSFRHSIRLTNNNLTATIAESLRVDGIWGLTSIGNVFNGQTNAIFITNTSINNTFYQDDYSGQTSDAINCQSTSSMIIFDGITVQVAGRHGFNFFGGCSHFKVMNSIIMNVGATTTGNAFNFAGSGTKIGHFRGNHVTDTVLNNVVSASAGMDRLFFNDNFYAASIVTPINSTATNSDTSGNHTF